MVWVGIFVLAVGMDGGNPGQIWVKVSPGKDQETEKIKSKSYYVGFEIYRVE